MHKAWVALTAVLPAFAAVAGSASTTLSTTSGAALSAAPVPAAAVTVHPDLTRLPRTASAAPPSTAQCQASYGIACYTPKQIQAAYGLQSLYNRGANGKGVTIMVVDPYGSPTIKADLAAFDKTFALPAPKLTVIAPAGKIPPFSAKNSAMVGWAGETTLDVEYAHAVAPKANILLVETPLNETEGNAGFAQIVQAEEYAMAHYKVGVISQSFSATEQTFPSRQLSALRGAYTAAQHRGVTVLAGTGDTGATNYKANGTQLYPSRVTAWPATDPLVTAVGGTQLEASGGGYQSVTWNDTYNTSFLKFWTGKTSPQPFSTGGGTSVDFSRPSYQNSVAGATGTHRGVPDISMSAACNGAVQVYSSYTFKGWSLVCGTSEATPEFAGVVAIADQVAGHSLGVINPALYKLAAAGAPGIVDVTSGNNTVAFLNNHKLATVKGYTAGAGYDLATGVGTLNAPALTYELAGKG